MHQPPNDSSASVSRRIVIFVGSIVILAVAAWGISRWKSHPTPPPAGQPVVTAPKPASPPSLAMTNATKPVLAKSAPPVPANYPDFKKRPLPMAYESTNSQWTLADGKDTNVIRQLAHNELEYQRMVEENSRIIKRELVYRKETVPQLLQHLLPTGQKLQNFTLPGVDGLEVQVEVTDTHVNGMAQSGSVNGRIKGQFNSMVSVGFYNGCESYNIISPDQNLYFVADAREPGEVIVKQIDPDKYSPPAGDTPDYILTGQSVSNSVPNQSISK
jgi:hypothetical protein